MADDVTTDVVNAVSIISRLRDRLTFLQTSIPGFRDRVDVEQFRVDLDKVEGIISRLRDRMINLQTSIQGLRDRVVELEGLDPDKIAHRNACSLVAHTALVAEQEAITEVKRLRAVEDKLMAEKNAARADLAAANSQVEELEKASLKDDETIERLRAGLAAAQEEINRLRAKNRPLRSDDFKLTDDYYLAVDMASRTAKHSIAIDEDVKAVEAAAAEIEASVPITVGARPNPVKSSDSLGTETPPWQRAKWDEALSIICNGGDWGRGNNFDHGILGALVIWADKEMDRLAAERNAARRERDSQRARAEAYSRTADELRSELNDAKTEADKLKGERDSFERLFRSVNDAANEKYDEDLDQARRDVHQANIECDRLKAKIERASAKLCDVDDEARLRGWNDTGFLRLWISAVSTTLGLDLHEHRRKARHPDDGSIPSPGVTDRRVNAVSPALLELQQQNERLQARVAELERAYSAECEARAQAHRELSDLNAAIGDRESGEERDSSYAAECRDAAAARDRADRMISAPAASTGDWVSDVDRVLQSETTLAHTEIISALTAELKAALRERDAVRAYCETLRHLLNTRERERETPWVRPTAAAPAENAGGEENPGEVRAWEYAVPTPHGIGRGVTLVPPTSIGWDVMHEADHSTCRPLVFKSANGERQEPSGWLMAEERLWLSETLDQCRKNRDARWDEGDLEGAALVGTTCARLIAILSRSTPPKVKAPTGWTHNDFDRKWIAAILKAGVEIEYGDEV